MLDRILGSGTRISVHTCREPLELRMDPSRFEQVVLNLVVNARDAMPKGGTIGIETTIETFGLARKVGGVILPAGRYARLAVTDAGEGIDADILPHIFEPFFTTKVEGGGSGIGLATCQSIAVEAGGAIEVQSTPGAGSRFDVYLPSAAATRSEGQPLDRVSTL
jgi:signal transduction histidine kinase